MSRLMSDATTDVRLMTRIAMVSRWLRVNNLVNKLMTLLSIVVS